MRFRKLSLLLALLALIVTGLSFSASTAWASGITLHLFMADLAVEYLPPSALKDLLQKNQNAYRSGSIFADSGYAANHAYGEFSHWHDFLNQYQQTLIERCPDPGATENCAKVWAHFFGTVAHALSDNNFDRYFVPQVAAHDFNGNIDKFTDTGYDFLAILDHQRGYCMLRANHPLEVLLEVFDRQGLAVSVQDLQRGIRKQRLVLLAEPLGSPFAYLYYKARMPWGSRNYLNARGGIRDTAARLASAWSHILAGLEACRPTVFASQGGWPYVTFYLDGIPLENFQ